MPMFLRLLSSVLLICTVAAATRAQTGHPADLSSIADLDIAAHQVLSPAPQESRETIDWLVRHGDRSSAAVLIQLLPWLPEYRDVLAARLKALIGANASGRIGSTGWCGNKTIRTFPAIQATRDF
jgi:hypothetical protein